MVGSGKECPGEVWFGKVRHGKARLCPVWWGVEWLGGVWFGKARLSNSSLKQGVLEMNYSVRQGVVVQGEARRGLARFGKVVLGLVR